MISLRKFIPLAAVIFIVTMGLTNAAKAQSCSSRPYCKHMKSCHDALYYLEICGYGGLDRDNDGIPCESICGQKMTAGLRAMKAKVKAAAKGNSALGLLSQPVSNGFSCSGKKKCSDLTSCEEAKYQLKTCGQKHLDGDRDGTPCNRLCR